MLDITYCNNTSCPFESCERHLVHVKKFDKDKTKYVSVANFGGTCREYLSYLIDEVKKDD